MWRTLARPVTFFDLCSPRNFVAIEMREIFRNWRARQDYGGVCQAITELAVELNAAISMDDCRTLNRCLDDDAISTTSLSASRCSCSSS
jgi:hypothetical protein